MPKKVSMRHTFVAISLSAVIGLAACGGSTNGTATPKVVVRNPVKLVAATADATARAKTAKVAVTATMHSGASANGISFEMDGSLALDGSAADFTMDLAKFLPTAPAGARVEVREVGTVMYIDFGALANVLGGAAGAKLGDVKWVKMDLKGLTGGSGTSSSPASFTQYLEYLRGVASNGVRTIGHETIRGVDTTHYRADISWTKAVDELQQRLAGMSSELRASLQQSIDALRNAKTSMVADVWIDGDGLTRRLEMHVPLPIAGAGSDSGMDMRIDLYDFGTPVDVQPPPPSEVTDLSSLAGGLASGGAASSI